MLNQLIKFSLSQRILVLGTAVVILFLGIRKTFELPVSVLPDLTKPTVTILTEAPGLASEEVETLITIPLENSLMGVPGVTRLRSVSDASLSLVFVEFDWGTDLYRARQNVQERLTNATENILDGILPYLPPMTSLMGNIMLIGLVDPSGKTPPEDLRELADWTISRQLQSIPGIAEVLAMGGGIKQIQVQPNPEKMLAWGITWEQIYQATANAVKNSSGGFLTESAQEIMVRNLGMTADLEEIATTLVSYKQERPILLKDVATVIWDIAPMRGDAGIGSKKTKSISEDGLLGYPGVILSLTKAPGFDTLSLTDQVEKAIKEIQNRLPLGLELVSVYRQADFIELSMSNLQEALRDGAIMVTIILFLFLFNVRITLITLTAIPLSLAIAILCFDFFDLSINAMTLGGFAVAIGMVVDDAIIDVENVFRRLRQNAQLSQPLPKITVIAKASAEVRSSIFYATLVIVLVFFPLLALSGLEGRLFSPIAIATMISLGASFIVSLTVIPVLCSLLLQPKARQKNEEIFLVRALKFFFKKTWLSLALSQPFLVILIVAGLLYWIGSMIPQMGGNFLPPFREPTLVIATTTPPGTSLQQTTQIAHRAQQLLLKIPEIKMVAYRVGRAEKGDHVVPVSTVEFDVEFFPEHQNKRTEIMIKVRQVMKEFPGTFSAMSGPLADRIGHMLSGVSAKVAIKVFGDDLYVLQRLGGEVLSLARSIPGLEEARGDLQTPVPQLRIEIDRDRALAYGVTPGELNQQLSALIGGEQIAEIYKEKKVYDLVVRLPLSWRNNLNRLAELPINNQSGQKITLSDIAQIRHATGPSSLPRENSQRRFAISINPTSSDLNQLVETLQQKVAKEIDLPKGYRITFEGEYQAQQQARKTIAILSLIVLLVITLLLFNYFKSFSLVILVGTIIPISLLGSVLLARYTLNNISIATLVGFVAITGIAARNNIMLLSHYLHLMRKEGESFSRKMIERATLERLLPIVMTASSAGLALIPFVLSANESGKEIINPVAIVIVGGLISSTLLGLAITPALFYTFCRKAAEKSIQLKAAASE